MMVFKLRTFVFFYFWNYGVSWIPTLVGLYLRAFTLRVFLKKAGTSLTIFPSIRMSNPENIEIGNNVQLGSGISLGAKGGISIGDDSMVGMRTIIGTGSNEFIRKNVLIRKQPHNRSPIIIGTDVMIGGACIILSGPKKITIGDGAVIGAGSRVIKDVPPYAMVSGNPARIVGKRR